jgi:hypothetical protein
MHQNSDDTVPAWVKEAHEEEVQHIFWLQEQQQVQTSGLANKQVKIDIIFQYQVCSREGTTLWDHFGAERN